MKKIILLAVTLSAILIVIVYGSLSSNKSSAQTQATIYTIVGKVFYPDGKIASDAMVYGFESLEGPTNGRIPTTTSDKDGQYTLEVGPDVHLLCAAKQSENRLLPFFLKFGLSVGGKCESINVLMQKSVDLTLAPRVASLKGHINNFSNVQDITVVIYRPLAFESGKWVLVSPDKATLDSNLEAKVDDRGNFILNGLPAGQYFLRIERGNKKVWYYDGTSANNAKPITISDGEEKELYLSPNIK